MGILRNGALFEFKQGDQELRWGRGRASTAPRATPCQGPTVKHLRMPLDLGGVLRPVISQAPFRQKAVMSLGLRRIRFRVWRAVSPMCQKSLAHTFGSSCCFQYAQIYSTGFNSGA